MDEPVDEGLGTAGLSQYATGTGDFEDKAFTGEEGGFPSAYSLHFIFDAAFHGDEVTGVDDKFGLGWEFVFLDCAICAKP